MQQKQNNTYAIIIIGILIMGISGGALIPKAFASLKEHYNFQLVFFALIIPCYLYILYYSIKGYAAEKAKAWNLDESLN